MQKPTNFLKSLQNSIRWKQVFLTLLIILVILLISAPFVLHFAEKTRARHILSEAKNVQLTMELLSIQAYGTDVTMRDDKRPSGLTEKAEKEILSMPELTGEIEVMGWSAGSLVPNAFRYTSGNYAVIYREIQRGNPSWQVYRVRKLIDLP